MLIGLCAFANTKELGTKKSETVQVLKNKVYSLSELNEALENKKVSITEINYNESKMICGFTLSYDNGAGTSWSTMYDCSGMTMSDVMYFLLRVFFTT
jgi:hypothetical protein